MGSKKKRSDITGRIDNVTILWTVQPSAVSFFPSFNVAAKDTCDEYKTARSETEFHLLSDLQMSESERAQDRWARVMHKHIAVETSDKVKKLFDDRRAASPQSGFDHQVCVNWKAKDSFGSLPLFMPHHDAWGIYINTKLLPEPCGCTSTNSDVEPVDEITDPESDTIPEDTVVPPEAE